MRTNPWVELKNVITSVNRDYVSYSDQQSDVKKFLDKEIGK